MGLTNQQAEAARANRSIAVMAGAGTGKTHMLAERYLFHLESGHSPLSIVALTFTEKAAAELRSRIRQTIRERLPHSDFVAELEAAQISTFHALAARVCREHPNAAGVPSDFVVLDNIDGTIWLAEALSEAMDHIPLSLYEKVPYTQMRTIMGALLADPLIAEKALAKQREDWLPDVQRLQQKALDTLLHHPIWLAAKDTLQTYTAPGDNLDIERENALNAIANIEQRQNLSDALQALCALKINTGSQKAWGEKENIATVKEAIKSLRDELAKKAQKQGLITLEANEWDGYTESILPTLREAFTHVRSHLSHAKQRQRVLDFNDLEIHALRALHDPDVRGYYAQRWNAYLIDEFQDTNPTQGELLELLTRNQLVTIVGDVKQSIYGFRRADVTVFQSWCDRIHSLSDPPKELNLSFRTHHALIQGINTIFRPVLNGLHQDLDAHRKTDPHPAPHLRLLTIQEKGTTAEQGQQIEAQKIAELIKQLLDDQVMVYDKPTGALRPIEYRDIAILSRTWAGLEIYGQALESQGIPALQAGGGSLLETREAKDAWAMLRFLADPTDDIALAAVLRGPFFAVSDRTLFHLSQTLPDQISWWKHLKQHEEGEIHAVIQVLQKLLIERRSEPPTRLLQLADRLTGYTAVIANLPNAARREADWRGFINFVRELEEGTNDVLTVVRRLNVLATHEVEVPRPALEAGNAVQLTTIHASKGLEWSVVVVANLASSPRSDSSPVRFDPDLGLALKLEDEDGEKQKSALYTLLEHRKRVADQDEMKRVLYVALTRARDHLILTAAKDKGGGLDVLSPGLTQCASAEAIALNETALKPLDIEDPPIPTLPPQILLQSGGSGLWELPVTALTDYAQCPKRFQYRYVHGHSGMSNGNSTYGTDIGTLTHWALQHRVQEIQALRQHAPHLPEFAHQEALNLAQRFQKLDVYAHLRHSDGVSEHPITLSVGTITFNGVIDWLIPDSVLDFKTDQVQDPHHHRLQLWVYAKATERPTAHIAYLRHDNVCTFTPQDLANLEDEVEIIVKAIAQGDYSPNPSPKSCRPCPYLEICDQGNPSV